MSAASPVFASLELEYSWRQDMVHDMQKYVGLMQQRLDSFLASRPGPLTVALYGGSESGSLLAQLLSRHERVTVCCVLDRHKPQNSLSGLPFVDTRAVPLARQSLKADILFLCISPAHNAALRREAETLQGVPLVCAMYSDEQTKKTEPETVFSERFVEYAFVFECLAEHYPKRVLDVGTGATALPSLVAVGGSQVTAIDHFAPLMANPSFYVWCHDIQHKRFDDPFDMILCVSTLEHVFDYESALENMVASLKPGGHLALTMPVTTGAYVENLFRVPGNFYHDPKSTSLARLFSMEMVTDWLTRHKLREVRRKCYSQFTGAEVGEGVPRQHPVSCDNGEPIHLACLLLRREA